MAHLCMNGLAPDGSRATWLCTVARDSGAPRPPQKSSLPRNSVTCVPRCCAASQTISPRCLRAARHTLRHPLVNATVQLASDREMGVLDTSDPAATAGCSRDILGSLRLPVERQLVRQGNSRWMPGNIAAAKLRKRRRAVKASMHEASYQIYKGDGWYVELGSCCKQSTLIMFGRSSDPARSH